MGDMHPFIHPFTLPTQEVHTKQGGLLKGWKVINPYWSMGFAEWICLGCFMLQEFKRKVLVLDTYETATSNNLPKMKILSISLLHD